MFELFVLASLRFPLRTPEENHTSAENRTHKFRLSGRVLGKSVHIGVCEQLFYLKVLSISSSDARSSEALKARYPSLEF